MAFSKLSNHERGGIMLTFEEFNDYIKKIREQLEYSDKIQIIIK